MTSVIRVYLHLNGLRKMVEAAEKLGAGELTKVRVEQDATTKLDMLVMEIPD